MLKRALIKGLLILSLTTPKEDYVSVCPDFTNSPVTLRSTLEDSIDKSINWFNEQGVKAKVENTIDCIPVNFYDMNSFITEFFNDEKKEEERITNKDLTKTLTEKDYNKFLEDHISLNNNLVIENFSLSDSLIEETLNHTAYNLMLENNFSDILAQYYSSIINSSQAYVFPKDKGEVKVNLQSVLMNYNHEFLKARVEKKNNKFVSEDMSFSKYLSSIISHEIGHALFLQHPEDFYNGSIDCEIPNIMNLKQQPSKEAFEKASNGRALSNFQKEIIRKAVTPGTSLYNKRFEDPFPFGKPLGEIIKKENITQETYECK